MTVAICLLLGVSLNTVGRISGAGSRKSFSSSFAPNFDPEFPHFTPFNAPDFIQMHSDLRVQDPVPVLASTSTTPARISIGNVSPHNPFPKRQHFSADEEVDDIQPFKSFVLDLYKNYRNAYLNGNQTIGGILGVSPEHLEQVIEFEQNEDAAAAAVTAATTTKTTSARPTKVRRRFQSKVRQPAPLQPPNSLFDNEVKYNVGPGVNISVDPNKELVNVYLDEDCLKDVFTGRGRKQDLISKILPLFILPFLIQSAIVPFAVTTLKLLLVKSIIVGKIAIFLLIISALKNHHSSKYASYDSPPQYVVGDPPSRRSEAVGYRVEGKPTTWVN